MNISRSVCGILVHRYVLDKLKSNLTGKLLNIGVIFQAADKFLNILLVLLNSGQLFFKRLNLCRQRPLLRLILLQEIYAHRFGNLAKHLVLVN